VNHQYDKSSFFLGAAKEYVQRFVHSGLQISSPINHMWDLEVAKVFCTHPLLLPFHGVYLSCNEPIDHTRWCGTCEKCAFVFLLMSAFLPPPQVWSVFGDDLFQKDNLTHTFLSLVGCAEQTEAKPFECVGTFGEAKAAVELSCRQWAKYSASHMCKAPNGSCHQIPQVLQVLSQEIGLTLTRVEEKPNDITSTENAAVALLRRVDDLFSSDSDDTVFDRVICRWQEKEDWQR
jgi:hypothetical protein